MKKFRCKKEEENNGSRKQLNSKETEFRPSGV